MMKQKKVSKDPQYFDVKLYGKLCSVEEFPGNIDNNCEPYLIHDSIVYQNRLPEELCIDTSQIPEHVRLELLEMTIELTKEYFKQPWGEEKYQRWLKERNASSKISPSVSP